MWAGLWVGNAQVSSVLNVAGTRCPCWFGLLPYQTPQAQRRNVEDRTPNAERPAPPCVGGVDSVARRRPEGGRQGAGDVKKPKRQRYECVKSEAHLLRSRGEAWRWCGVSVSIDSARNAVLRRFRGDGGTDPPRCRRCSTTCWHQRGQSGTRRTRSRKSSTNATT